MPAKPRFPALNGKATHYCVAIVNPVKFGRFEPREIIVFLSLPKYFLGLTNDLNGKPIPEPEKMLTDMITI